VSERPSNSTAIDLGVLLSGQVEKVVNAGVVIRLEVSQLQPGRSGIRWGLGTDMKTLNQKLH
jgi:hypothetical protein